MKKITPKYAVLSAFLFSALITNIYSATKSDSVIVEEAVIDSRLGTFEARSDDTAANIVYNMGFGLNLGNSLDAVPGTAANGYTKNAFENAGLSTENCWGRPSTTQTMIKAIKQAGFRTIRIPISWHEHIINKNYDIDPEWMARVKTVVDWAYNEDLYVIINIHHDSVASGTVTDFGNGYCPAPSDKELSKIYLTKIWTQICATFKDYSNHLIFETMNEPRLVGDSHEWGCDPNCKTCKESISIINEFNQMIVDLIRSSGSNNKKRLIMVPPYVASPDAAFLKQFVVPKDPANMIALSVHMYTPYNFAMESPGSKTFTQDHKNTLNYYFSNLKSKFCDKGIPVVIGEMGATNKNNISEREKWFEFFVTEARKKGMSPVLWDNGSYTKEIAQGNGSEVFGFFNKKNCTFYFPTLITKSINCVYENTNSTKENGAKKESDIKKSSAVKKTSNASSDGKEIWTGQKDLKHWKGEDGINLSASKFTSAKNSSYLEITISKGAECKTADCSNNYSVIHPVSADWTNMALNFETEFPAIANNEHQLDVASAIPETGTVTVTIKPDSAAWNTIKSKGLVLFGHKVVITKIVLK